jgi:membrane protein DedA with SNARE-associated domain
MKGLVSTLISWGPLGVLLLAVIDSAGIPIPGGVDALVMVLAAVDPADAYLAAGAAVVGSVIGNLILFWIARRGGEAYLAGHTLSGRGARFRAWFGRYGLLTVFIPAVLPIPLPLKVFVLSAGALGVHPVTFLIVVLVARIPRYFGLAYLGSQLGSGAGAYLKDHVRELLLIAGALFVVLYLMIRVVDWMRDRNEAIGRA